VKKALVKLVFLIQFNGLCDHPFNTVMQ